MAVEEGGAGPAPCRSLQDTPTWALATVCFVFIFTGIFIEYLIHLLSHWLKKSRKTALYEAMEKLKSVLMVLGFMSLILAATQRSIMKICIPDKVANRMLPCRQTITKTTKSIQERMLAAESDSDYCGSRGMTSLISESGINQLNIFIFVMAIMQIVYTVLTMALGRAKMRRWKAWERETQTFEYQAANDPNRFRYTRQTTFARRHMSSIAATSTQLWIKCFFRQFFSSVAKVDHLTLRHGFLVAHLPNNSSFNFQRYIQRSLDDNFKEVVGIRPWMWLVVVIFMLVDIHGLHVYLWVSFIPLLIVLLLGTKLGVVVAEMALQIQDHSSVIKGAPLVQPNDSLFWFSHPKHVLTLIHFTLFMNAFELAFFVWVTLQYGIHSCYHESVEIIVVRVVLAVTVQIMCSYITLPLYALVTQEKERGEITGGQRRAMAGDDEKPSRNRERTLVSCCSNKRTRRDMSCCSNKRARRDRDMSCCSNKRARRDRDMSCCSNKRARRDMSCCSNKRARRDMSCCSNKRTRREIPSSPEQSSVSLNDLQPLLIEILHRLPSTQSAFLCKSVCKIWCSLISSPYFARRFLTHHLNHDYKQNPSAILISYWSKPSWNVLFTFSDEPMFRFDLSYLPERNGCVRVSAIVNDLMLCCVDKIEIGILQYYICNPFTMQWVALPLLEADYMNDYKVGFVCEPYYFEDDRGKCFINSKYRFRVVHFTKIESTQIVMKTYCSETRKWDTSVLKGNAEFWWITDVVPHNGKLFWCNREHIFSYDPFNPELPTSINCSYMQTRMMPAMGKCFGVRQGFLCLMELIGVGSNRTFHIWKLKDYNNGEWSLEDRVSLDAMIPESSLVPEIVDGRENELKPLGFHPSNGNIVYFHFQTYVISFNTRTKELKMAGKIPGERDSFCHGKVFHVELPLWPTPIAKTN